MKNNLKRINIKESDIKNDNFSIENESLKSLECIVDNYNVLIKDEFFIMDKLELINISKPKLLYEIFFCMELLLKLYLIKETEKNLDEIGRYRHNIDNMINELKSRDSMSDIDTVYNLLKKFKNKNEQRISFNEYYHFKYNHKPGSKELMFPYSLEDDEIKIIKEVIEWMKNHLN